MPRAVPLTTAIVFASLPLVGSGCVPQDKYDQLLMAKRTTEEQLVRAEDERDTLQASLDSALAELSTVRTSYESLEGEYTGLDTMVDEVMAQNRDYLRRISEIEFGPLPADMESALQELAASYPDVLSFDARYGMIRFASDFTFDLGSTELTADAQATVVALARILTTETASVFEARIIGHTDDVPIRRPDTRAKHPTNVHLSVHRSIAVREVLVGEGVDPERVLVAGYGQFRPIVENRRGGAAENRRVEIFLVPSRRVVDAAAPATDEDTAVAPETDAPMK
ncbi:MAG: OmpA/MotB family protein [Planctomycetota bacterium]|jgi:chemotaxis protein MotB